jgi:hypothetical protein
LIFLKVAALFPSSFDFTFAKSVSTFRWSVFNSSIASGDPSVANIFAIASIAEEIIPLPFAPVLRFLDAEPPLFDLEAPPVERAAVDFEVLLEPALDDEPVDRLDVDFEPDERFDAADLDPDDFDVDVLLPPAFAFAVVDRERELAEPEPVFFEPAPEDFDEDPELFPVDRDAPDLLDVRDEADFEPDDLDDPDFEPDDLDDPDFEPEDFFVVAIYSPLRYCRINYEPSSRFAINIPSGNSSGW